MKMKHILSAIAVGLATLAAPAQTLNVASASQTDQYPSAQAGEMTYTGGTQLTILGKTYSLSEITRMYTDETAVTDL